MASFYLQAASILDELAERQNSLKAIIASLPAAQGRSENSGNRHANSRNDGAKSNDQAAKRRLLALCANTLAYKDILNEIVDKVQLRKEKDFKKIFLKGGAGFPAAATLSNGKGDESGRPSKKPKLNHDASKPAIPERSEPSKQPSADSLLLVLLHDLLIVSTSPRSKSTVQTSASYPPTTFLLSHRARLHSQLVRIQISRGASNFQQLRSDQEEREKAERIPRWVRLNIARGEGTEVEQEWRQWLRERSLKEVVGEGVQWLEEKNQYHASAHVQNVWALHPSQSSSLLSSPLYKSGRIILQDLASCFPAEILVQWYASRLRSKDAANNPRNRSVHAVDATAAPGNKTSHLSTLLFDLSKESGDQLTKLTAFERDLARFKTMKMLLGKCGALEAAGEELPKAKKQGKRKAEDGSGQQEELGAHNVTCVRADFLTTDPTSFSDNDDEDKDEHPWADVQLMMLDPSCSGSGILGRLDHLSRPDSDEADEVAIIDADEDEGADKKKTAATSLESRLASLATFQLSMIAHAMRFPALEAFTYSTCSVHAEENEHVVRRALELPIAKERGWRLAGRKKVLPEWKSRGWRVDGLSAEQSDAMIRADAGGSEEHIGKDVLEKRRESMAGGVHVEATNGFFVCLFERQMDGAQQGAGEEVSKKRKKKKKKRKSSGSTVGMQAAMGSDKGVEAEEEE